MGLAPCRPERSRKSTRAPDLSGTIENIIGPDAIAEQLLPSTPGKAALQAGREAIGRIHDSLNARRSFAIETTLSGRFHFRVARTAKSQGWNVGIVYIGLRSAGIGDQARSE